MFKNTCFEFMFIKKEKYSTLFERRAFIDIEQIVNSLLVLFSLLVIPYIFITLSKITYFGYQPQFLLDIGFALIVIILAQLRYLFKYHVKLITALIFAYISGIVGLLYQGFESVSWLAFILVAIFAVLLYNIRISILSVFVSLITILIIVWLHNSGTVEKVEYNKGSVEKTLLVISNVWDIILWLGLIIYIINHISRRLNTLLQNKNAENAELNATVSLLNRKIGENIKLQKNIIQKEKNFRNIFDGSKDPIVICDLECNYITSNKSFKKLIGEETYNLKEIKVYQMLLPNCRDSFINQVNNNLFNDFDPEEVELITQKGIIEFEAKMQVIEYYDNQRIMIVFRNISERKRSKKLLEESNNRWRIAEIAINMGIIDWNLETGSVILSEQMQNILDINNENQLTVKDLQSFIHPLDQSKYRSILTKRLNTVSKDRQHRTFYDPIEYRIIVKSGLSIYLKEYGAVYYKNSVPYRYVSAIVDNTEITSSVKKLNQQRKYFSDLVAAIKNSFIVIRGVNRVEGIFKDFVVLNANQAFLQLTNKEIEDVFEKTISSILPGLDNSFFINCSEAVLKGNPVVEEIYSEDLKKYLSITYQKVKYKSLFLIIEDITDKKMMQNNMLNSIISAEEKERARISKELHDGIGPLLSTLKMFTEKYCTTNKPEIKQEIEPQLYNIIDEAISNISTISNNLTPKVLENFGLDKALKKQIKQFEIASGCKIEFTMNTEERFRDEIEISIYRALTEILNNSIKYSDSSLIRLDINFNGKVIKVKFSDNGKGFDYEKELKKKKGQGLINIKSRIESIGGKVEFKGGINKGSKYQIELPV